MYFSLGNHKEAVKHFEAYHKLAKNNKEWTKSDNVTLYKDSCIKLYHIYTIFGLELDKSGDEEDKKASLSLLTDALEMAKNSMLCFICNCYFIIIITSFICILTSLGSHCLPSQTFINLGLVCVLVPVLPFGHTIHVLTSLSSPYSVYITIASFHLVFMFISSISMPKHVECICLISVITLRFFSVSWRTDSFCFSLHFSQKLHFCCQ